MKILYNHSVATFSSYGGIARYSTELLTRICKYEHVVFGWMINRNQEFIEKKVKPDKYGQIIGKFLINNNLFNFINLLIIKVIWGINALYFTWTLLIKKIDIVHFLCYSDAWCLFWVTLLKKPYVYTVHDMIPEIFPACQTKILKKRKTLAIKANHIIAVSENTKNDIMRFWGVDNDKISVVYHAPVVHEINENGKTHDKGSYILYVGGRNQYKNFQWFVQVVADLLLRDKQLKLICTGNEFSISEKKMLNKLGIQTQCFAGFINASDFYNIYSNAKVMVYPSQYEGFGIPILDAFQAGCPVVLSNASCFPEVARDAAIYFDLGDEEGCKKAVHSFIYNENLRMEYIQRGKERIKYFSWDKATHETIEVYNKVIRDKKGK